MQVFSYFMKIIYHITNLNEFDIQGAQARFKGFSADAGCLLKIWESKSTSATAEIRVASTGCFIPPASFSHVFPAWSSHQHFSFFQLLLAQLTPQKLCWRRKAVMVRRSSSCQTCLLPHSLPMGAGSPFSTLLSPIISSTCTVPSNFRGWREEDDSHSSKASWLHTFCAYSREECGHILS